MTIELLLKQVYDLADSILQATNSEDTNTLTYLDGYMTCLKDVMAKMHENGLLEMNVEEIRKLWNLSQSNKLERLS